jgi:tetratricopeptide (TPR) repeat protein
LGLVGLVFFAPAPPRRLEYLVWLAFVPSYAISIAVFFMAERYRLPLLVPLCLGSAAAIDGAWRAVITKRGTTLVVPAIACVLILAFANRPLPVHDGRWEEGLRLAEHLVTIGQYDDAEAWVARLESNAAQRGRADFGVGVQLRLAGQTARAVPHLQRATDARVPRSADELAIALQQSGDAAGAAKAIASVTPDATTDAETWLARGRLAMQARAPLEAERFFKQAVQLAPNQAGARLQYGLNLLVLDRCDAAIVELSAAHRLDPKDPEPLAHLAYCEIKLGQIEAGRAHAVQALALDPAHALARQLVGK